MNGEVLLVTSVNKAEVMWSFCLWFCKRSNRRRPNLTGMGKEARSDPLEVFMMMIRILVWILDHFFIFFTIAEWGIFGHFLAFLKQQEVKVIWQKAPHGGPIPRLGVTPGGRKLYRWIPGVGFPISVP